MASLQTLLAPSTVACALVDGKSIPLIEASAHYCAERCYRAGSEDQCPNRSQCLGLFLDQHFGTEAENPHLDLDPSY